MTDLERARIVRLPADGVWEIAWAPIALALGDEVVDRALVVFDTASGPRHVGVAGGDDLPEVSEIFLSPLHGVPGRPSELRCADAGLRELLDAELDGAVRVVQAPTPLADGFGASIGQVMRPPPAPGVTAALAEWRQAFARLVAQRPWELTHDEGAFTFSGDDLEGSVGLFVGGPGESPGFVLFTSWDALERFTTAADGPPEGWLEIEQLALHLDPPGELSDEDRQRCEVLGLASSEHGYLRVVVTDAGHVRAPDEREERRLLAALEAVLSLCERHPDAIASASAAEADVRTSAGDVRVCWPGGDPELLPFADHFLQVSDDGPRLVLSLEPEDEGRALEVLGFVDEIRAERADGVLELIAWRGGARCGFLTEFPAEHADAVEAAIERSGRMELWVRPDGSPPRQVTAVPCRVAR